MVTMPSRGSLICISIAAETICRMRTASLRARAGSAIGPPGSVASGSDAGDSICVAEQLPVGRQKRHLGPVGQQQLARVEHVGDRTGVAGDAGDTDLCPAVQVGV